jgi:hypothetical protein
LGVAGSKRCPRKLFNVGRFSTKASYAASSVAYAKMSGHRPASRKTGCSWWRNIATSSHGALDPVECHELQSRLTKVLSNVKTALESLTDEAINTPRTTQTARF